MQEESQEPKEQKSTYSRKACLADFLDGEEVPTKNHKNQHTYNNQSDTISKNQEEHGHRKRIKP